MTMTIIITIPRSRVLLEKLAIAQMDEKFPAFYGTRRFITVLTRNCHWTLSALVKSSPQLPTLLL
jgi:hypothetical protein